MESETNKQANTLFTSNKDSYNNSYHNSRRATTKQLFCLKSKYKPKGVDATTIKNRCASPAIAASASAKRRAAATRM
uniref:Uncharacterized protein n=1 Tax=Romanomermis culicivorax TaxID=13658 RepID=A0A915HM01_ROMCU